MAFVEELELSLFNGGVINIDCQLDSIGGPQKTNLWECSGRISYTRKPLSSLQRLTWNMLIRWAWKCRLNLDSWSICWGLRRNRKEGQMEPSTSLHLFLLPDGGHSVTSCLKLLPPR